MSSLFAIVGVAYAALCIWLTVRIVNRREKWAIVAIIGLLAMVPLYLLSGEILTQPGVAQLLPKWAESACHWLYPHLYGYCDL